jgi:hypothetical protein
MEELVLIMLSKIILQIQNHMFSSHIWNPKSKRHESRRRVKGEQGK